MRHGTTLFNILNGIQHCSDHLMSINVNNYFKHINYINSRNYLILRIIEDIYKMTIILLQ